MKANHNVDRGVKSLGLHRVPLRRFFVRTLSTLVLILPLAAAFVNAHAQSISFNSPRAYLTGAAVSATALGDFNSDGKLDAAVTSPDTDSVSVFLGNGDGTLTLAGTYPAGSGPGPFVPGDFNGDGKLDLAIIDQGSSTLSFLAGNGNGTFQAPVESPLPSSRAIVSIVAGDFNQDGRLDIALADGTEFVSVLLGNGRGTFSIKTLLTPRSAPTTLATGDFNNDGHLDLVTVDVGGEEASNENVAVLLGNGDGTFQAPKYAAVPNPSGVAVGDFNRDGKLDVAVTENTAPGAVLILLGDGDGTLHAGQQYSVGDNAAVILTADFNNDGRLDVAADTGTGTAILLGNGDGTFRGKPGDRIDGVAAGDFNGDGNVDLAGLAGGPVVMLGNGKGSFQGVNAFSTANVAGYVTIADFNLDGAPDLAVVDEHLGTVAILLGTGNGTVGSPTVFPAGRLAAKPVVADFNGDGSPDLAVPISGSYGDNVSVLLGQGNGAFAPAAGYACGTANAAALAAADFNNDGVVDLAVAAGNAICTLLGDGDGKFRAGPQSNFAGSPLNIVAGDFNRDGNMDVAAVVPESGSIFVLLGNGQGEFGSPASYPIGSFPIQIATADLTGSGVLDLVVTNQGNPEGSVNILLGNGDGTFQAPETYPVGYIAGALAVADFNGDGTLDIAVAVSGFQELSVLPGAGNGTFGALVAYAVASVFGGVDISAADFNRDGKSDLAVANGPENCISILTNDSR